MGNNFNVTFQRDITKFNIEPLDNIVKSEEKLAWDMAHLKLVLSITHKDQILNFEPPIINFVAYVTGGLRKLCSQIQSQEANLFPLYEYGQFTNHSGQFIAKRDCLLASRYRVVEVVGTGSRGQSAVIVRAKDEFDGNKLVVIKILHTNWRWLGAQEAHCLWKLQVADPYRASSTSRLLNVFMHDDHYCMVFEALCPEPLTAIFTEIPRDQVLPCLRKVTLRLLSTLGFLKQQNVIHADLKPENILLKKEGNLSSVTVIDFGNAMHHIFPEVSLYYKDFVVQTPLYRAPEVMFGIPFGTEIDMWSLGCILAELYKGTQLFHGTSKIPLIKEMTRLLGPFPLKVYQRGKFYSSLKQYTADVVQKDASAVLEKKLGCHDYLFRDFLAGLLRYDPDERMTPYQAARHPFLCSDLPLAFLLPNSKDLKLFNEYSFKPVKNYTGTNTYVENIGESSAFKVEVKVLKDDDLYNEEDKKAYRKGEKLDDNRNKGVKEKECLRNQMDGDDVKEAHFEHQSLDIKKPLLSETYTIEEDVSETRKTVGYQKDNSVSNYENRTACPLSSQIHGRNDDRLSSTINKSCVDNKMKECKKRSDNHREKIQREHNLDKGLKRKVLDCDDISDNSSRSKMEGRALGRNRSKIETRKYEDQIDSDEFYKENSFPDLPQRSKQNIHETKTRTSHHDNAKFQLGSKPDLQSIMKAISREQEIVERDLKRKSDETFLYRNERKKKDNSHYVQSIPKGIADRDFMCSGTTECTESEESEDDEFGTESDAESMCRSGITVSKKGYRMDKQDGRIQKTKSSNGTNIQSTCTMNEQNDEVDSMQNLVFPKKRKSEGELSDQNCRKSRQNKNETRKSQSSDFTMT
ncbi:hypothetical protein FSP39_000160 [Pinctada imbricata]|uniref:Protein kinase domain-containing protein n=1 Tax=Pinctada imbricata TaxID=66713 RepID=A0AA88XUF3_PINIB|nr:hypothetical protein FSP39_000160 [Pinctada imbricata]